MCTVLLTAVILLMSLYQCLWQVLWTVLTGHSLWVIVDIFCELVFLSRITFIITTVSLEVNQQRWEIKLLRSCPGSRKDDSMIVASKVLVVLPGRDLSASDTTGDMKRYCCSWRWLCVPHTGTLSYRDNFCYMKRCHCEHPNSVFYEGYFGEAVQWGATFLLQVDKLYFFFLFLVLWPRSLSSKEYNVGIVAMPCTSNSTWKSGGRWPGGMARGI